MTDPNDERDPTGVMTTFHCDRQGKLTGKRMKAEG
jgi:YD repeat-containing protein